MIKRCNKVIENKYKSIEWISNEPSKSLRAADGAAKLNSVKVFCFFFLRETLLSFDKKKRKEEEKTRENGETEKGDLLKNWRRSRRVRDDENSGSWLVGMLEDRRWHRRAVLQLFAASFSTISRPPAINFSNNVRNCVLRIPFVVVSFLPTVSWIFQLSPFVPRSVPVFLGFFKHFCNRSRENRETLFNWFLFVDY